MPGLMKIKTLQQKGFKECDRCWVVLGILTSKINKAQSNFRESGHGHLIRQKKAVRHCEGDKAYEMGSQLNRGNQQKEQRLLPSVICRDKE